MGDPALFIDYLPVGHIRPVQDISLSAKDQRLRALCTLIDSDDILHCSKAS